MKRLRNCPSSSSALEEKKSLMRDTIISLTAPQTNQLAHIQPTKKPREFDFLVAIHRWLARGKPEISKVQKRGCYITELEDRMERLEKQVEELKQQVSKPDHGFLLDARENSMLLLPETRLVGEEFEANCEKIMGWLRNPKVSKIGVYGMGGVGKTALLKHIHNKLIRDNGIYRPYWVSVPQCDTVHKLQGSIAKLLGLDMSDEEDDMKRASKLYTRLAETGNVVLILDDMWQPLLPHEVGIPLSENGCKIILTTRSLEVCRRMGCRDFVIKVETLPYDEVMALFVDILEDYDTLTEEVKNVARSAAFMCYGLPLAINTIAIRMIGVVDMDEWRNVLDELLICEQVDIKDKVFWKLQSSYDSLDGLAQKCFLSSMFYLRALGRIYIPRNELIALWVEEGLLDETGNSESRLIKGRTIMSKLVNMCLVEEVEGEEQEEEDYTRFHSVKYVTFHHLIERLAFHLMHENHVHVMINGRLGLIQVSEDEVWREDLVKISLVQKVKIPLEMSPKCPNLTVLSLKGCSLVKLPESFFIHMEALTVLNLSHMDIESLPSSVSDLVKLRTLKLAHCKKLAQVPSLAKLVKLKVLDLWCGLSSVEGHMGIEKLKLLENSNIMWNDWAYFNSLLESWPFSSLHNYRFVLHNGFQDIKLRDELRTHVQHDREIFVIAEVWNEVIQLPRDVQRLRIHYFNRKSLGDAFSSASVAKMLKIVELYNCRGTEYILSSVQKACSIFSQVNTLKVSCMADMREIIKLAQEHESPQIPAVFPHLRHLSVKSCPKFRSLVWPNSAQPSVVCFSNLETLTLSYCGELQDLTFKSYRVDVRVADTCTLVVPNLRDLRLEWLPKLEGTVCRGLLYTSLHELTIMGCCQVKEVFSLNISQHSQSSPWSHL